MTIQTGPGDHSILSGCGCSLKGLKLVINGCWMLGPFMTVLAKLGDLAGEELGVVASVGGVTDQAVLFDRGMLPHVRASLFGVALVT